MFPLDVARNDEIFRLMLNQQGVFYFDEAGNIDLTSPQAVQALKNDQKAL